MLKKAWHAIRSYTVISPFIWPSDKYNGVQVALNWKVNLDKRWLVSVVFIRVFILSPIMRSLLFLKLTYPGLSVYRTMWMCQQTVAQADAKKEVFTFWCYLSHFVFLNICLTSILRQSQPCQLCCIISSFSKAYIGAVIGLDWAWKEVSISGMCEKTYFSYCITLPISMSTLPLNNQQNSISCYYVTSSFLGLVKALQVGKC